MLCYEVYQIPPFKKFDVGIFIFARKCIFMKWTGLNELRKLFLDFFESKNHMILKSFSLVPKDDNSLLLINSGMAPMKKYFTGEVTPPKKRVTTCQKCVRTPDIERVGITSRHGTFFEMLGNFSFGDYFKRQATAWAWEFCTKVLELPIDKIWVSIYENDDEAFDIWVNEVGVAPERIVRLGKEDNFWEHGAGPCGPCSELYFDRGEKYGCGKPGCGVGCDCDRYVEFWNLVFTQFNSDGKGNYAPLEHPNIDTGMGLERLACIMQGVDNLFLVDTVQNIMKRISEIVGVKYGEDEKKDISLRVITDHVRSAVFMIGDGVIPSNEGRGYVLRRLLRRALRHGRLLGIKKPFLSDICDSVINENGEAYPELVEKRELIKKLIKLEEESFEKTIDQGMQILNNFIKNSKNNVLSGEEAFKLNDTYGFPIDLTKEIIAEHGMKLDEEKFSELLLEQKKRARNARKNAGMDAWIGNNISLEGIKETEFLGYDKYSTKAKILLIIKDGEKVEQAFANDEILIVLDKTPFYAESGGQVGDTGNIISKSSKISVLDTTKDNNGIFLHKAVVDEGIISCGDELVAEIDLDRRHNIMRNHTAAHLLQAALRKILGNHVEQAGQLVDGDRLRFDFTHFCALKPEELKSVEDIVNEEILKGVNVECLEMPIEEARKLGAMALFGEKYGDIVRVVKAEDGFSTEFCGGTHVDNTSKLGLFKIMSESSVASGVRRIEACTGKGVLEYLNKNLDIINNCVSLLKLSDKNGLIDKCEQLNLEVKEYSKEIKRLNDKIAESKVEKIISNAEEIEEIRIISSKFEDTNPDSLRKIGDKIKDKLDNCVAVLVGLYSGKAILNVVVGDKAILKGMNAGKIVKEVAKIAGGNGGGKANFAMAGIKDMSKIEEALNSVKDIVKDLVKN